VGEGLQLNSQEGASASEALLAKKPSLNDHVFTSHFKVFPPRSEEWP
jgi:hypothetical protein